MGAAYTSTLTAMAVPGRMHSVRLRLFKIYETLLVFGISLLNLRDVVNNECIGVMRE